MATTLTFTFTAENAQRLLEALTNLYGYNAGGEKTPEQFAKRKVREWMISQVQRYERMEAMKQIKTAVDIEVS